jgi:DNA-binding response OmpR family regulator
MAPQMLTGCLIVEDQALIAMALEASLEEAGIAVLGVFSSNAGALSWLSRNTPQMALIDVVLKDGACTALAQALRQKGVPFAIYSGLPLTDRRPCELKGVPWLEKPASQEALAATLMQLRSVATSGPPAK